MRNNLIYSVAIATLIITTITFWPILHGNFVWADVTDFVENSWLTRGDEWKHYLFKDFNNWSQYFRPLVIALFTLQLRLFGVTPPPMHAVSLAMHLINVLLVGLLAWHCSRISGHEVRRSATFVGISMLLYGIHPIQVETVAWIGCQFELVATMFMLGGLLANTRIQSPNIRAITVASLFFLAACAKESAASFPMMLVILEWTLLPKHPDEGIRASLQGMIRRNWRTYATILFAGIGYLVFRHWALGKITNPVAVNKTSIVEQMQEVCFIYLQYWKMLIWPMSGMNPLHEMSTQRFQSMSASSAVVDAAALVIVFSSAYFALKRKSPTACIVAMMTAGLLPVLHVAPVAFTPSLYHERYAMTSLAAICFMLPLIPFHLPSKLSQIAWLRMLLTALGGLWIILALINIRMTIPLWSNNVALWQWAVSGDPDSISAKDNLLNAYINSRNYRAADVVMNQLSPNIASCADCALNAAALAVAENNPQNAAKFLQQVQRSKDLVSNKTLTRMYIFTLGKMLVEQGHLQDAEGAFRETIKLDPSDPQPQLWLAISLIMQDKKSEASEVRRSAMALLPPSQRNSAQTMFEEVTRLNTPHSVTTKDD
jgi:protein O-mannosyl-transferase